MALPEGLLFLAAILSLAPQAPDAGGPADPEPLRFKVVTWYDRDRPFDSFRYRAYDVGKGEYTKAVDDWRSLMDRKYPGYTVTVLDVAVTEGDPARKIAEAVEEQKYILAKAILRGTGIGSERRGFSSRYSYSSGYLGFGSPPSPRRSTSGSPFKNSVPRSFSQRGASDAHSRPWDLYPNPFPYPRPHP
jgi:hypothetical protein